MNETREIYWNLGRWVIIPMYALVALTFGLLAYGIWRRSKVWRSARRLDRRDHPFRRLGHSLLEAVSQRKVLRVASGGLPHALFFWGFLVLFVGTLLIMLQVDFLRPVFHVAFLKGWFYLLFSLATDVGGLAAIAGLTALAVRRFIIRPKGLVTVADDYLMHGLLFAILISGFVIEAARMAATELRVDPALASWSPVGLLLAHALRGMSISSLRTLHRAFWWIHLGLVFAFIGMIPFTKFRHLLTTPVNYFFRPHEAKGTIATLDLEDETAEQFGAAMVADLSWKDIYDTDACTSCKRCQDRCPAWNTDKPLSPMTVIQEIGRVAFENPGGELVEAISADAIWA